MALKVQLVSSKRKVFYDFGELFVGAQIAKEINKNSPFHLHLQLEIVGAGRNARSYQNAPNLETGNYKCKFKKIDYIAPASALAMALLQHFKRWPCKKALFLGF